jgi:hypothetical protein
MPAAKPYKKPDLMDKVGKEGKLTLEECKCCLNGNLCLFCGTFSHKVNECRKRLTPPTTTSPRLARPTLLLHNPPIRVQKNSEQSSVLHTG